jgi:mono/diheme cytochrome c family protein
MMIGSRALLLFAALALAPATAVATVEMQLQARRQGLEVHNCLYCHASPHAIDKMKERAKSLGMSEGNCLACHGANIPAGLNQRGAWLVAEKKRRTAKACDGAWLKDYQEPAPAAPKKTARP